MSVRLRAMMVAVALLALTPAGASIATAESGTAQSDKSKQPGQHSAENPSSSEKERNAGQKSDPKASGGNLGEDKTSTSGSAAPPKGNTSSAPGPADSGRGGY